MTLDALLADPALIPQSPLPAPSPAPRLVRFRPGSAFAADHGIAAGTIGTVLGTFDEDGQRYANVWIEGGPMCFMVAREDVEGV